MLDGGRWTLDVGRWTLDVGRWTLDVERWTLDVGRWTLDVGRWTLDVGRWTLDVGRSSWCHAAQRAALLGKAMQSGPRSPPHLHSHPQRPPESADQPVARAT